jgi:hypothetical protein
VKTASLYLDSGFVAGSLKCHMIIVRALQEGLLEQTLQTQRERTREKALYHEIAEYYFVNSENLNILTRLHGHKSRK